MKDNRGNAVAAIVVSILIFAISFVFLTVIQAVKFYTFDSDEGDEVVFGFDRGFGGSFTSWDFEVDKQNNITVKKSGTVMLSGYVATAEGVQIEKQIRNIKGAAEIKTESSKNLEYTIYNDNGTYYFIANFEKAKEVGLVVWTTTSMNEEDAVDLLERLQGTKGVGYYIGCACDFISDMF